MMNFGEEEFEFLSLPPLKFLRCRRAKKKMEFLSKRQERERGSYEQRWSVIENKAAFIE